jgi:hypothetical protein
MINSICVSFMQESFSKLETHHTEHISNFYCYFVVMFQVVHASGADILKAKLADVRRVDIMPCCGHAVNLDQPGLFASFLTQFYTQLNSTAS